MKQSRAEQLQERLGKLSAHNRIMNGDTLYIFENHKRHDLVLPQKSNCGKKIIPPGHKFEGDAYFLNLMKAGEVRLVSSRKIESPQETPPETQINEGTSNMEKLILDQPDKVTQHGKTEHVVVDNTKAHQTQNNVKKESNVFENDILLNENPMSGIDIING